MHVLSTLSTISIDLACAVFILYCFTLLGHSIRSLLPASEWTPPLAVLWDVYQGLTAAAAALTLLGMAGLFYLPVFLAVLGAGLLLNCRGRSALLAPWCAVRDVVRSLRAERWAGLSLAVPAVITLIAAAVPEIFYDACDLVREAGYACVSWPAHSVRVCC
jgi:hypothetical protein